MTLQSLVQSLEARVGPPLESAAHSEAVATVLAGALKLRARVRRGAEGASRRLLHAVNLPTAADVRRMDRRLAKIERHVEEIGRRDSGRH